MFLLFLKFFFQFPLFFILLIPLQFSLNFYVLLMVSFCFLTLIIKYSLLYSVKTKWQIFPLLLFSSLQYFMAFKTLLIPYSSYRWELQGEGERIISPEPWEGTLASRHVAPLIQIFTVSSSLRMSIDVQRTNADVYCCICSIESKSMHKEKELPIAYPLH